MSTSSVGELIKLKVKFTDDAIAGASAGGIARMISAPFDVIKIRFQLQSQQNRKYTSIIQSLQRVVKEEGVLSLWKGNLSASYLWISYMTVQFSFYGVLKRIGEKTPNPFQSSATGEANSTSLSSDKAWRAFMQFLAGAGAGTASVVATYPFDIMRTQFALQGKDVVFKSIGSFVAHTYRTKGVKGFYAGLVPAMVGITPQMGLNFAFYETFRAIAMPETSAEAVGNKKNKDSFALATLKKGICGGAAGGLSKLIVYPLDTVKKRLQGQALTHSLSDAVHTARYEGVMHCFATIRVTEGLQGFYRGLGATVAKSVVSTAITFAAYEAVKDLLASGRESAALAPSHLKV